MPSLLLKFLDNLTTKIIIVRTHKNSQLSLINFTTSQMDPSQFAFFFLMTYILGDWANLRML